MTTNTKQKDRLNAVEGEIIPKTKDEEKKAQLIALLTGSSLEEPKAEEPKAEEPKAQEPKAQEPKAEEPKAEEPKAEKLSKPISNNKKRKTTNKKNKKVRDDLINLLTKEDETNKRSDRDEIPKDFVSPDSFDKAREVIKSDIENSLYEKQKSSLIDLILKIVPKESLMEFYQEVQKVSATSLNLELPPEVINQFKKSNDQDLVLEKKEVSIKAPKKTETKRKRTVNDSLLIHWNGRFGNRMHTYAYLHNRAKKLGGEVFLPSDWEGKHLFNLDYKIVEDDDFRLGVNQTIQQFDTLQHRLQVVDDYNARTNFNFKYCNPDDPTQTYKDYKGGVCVDSVCAYHHKIFDEMNISDILKLYEFNDQVKNLDMYKRLEDKQGTYDIAHLRRDDISNVNYKKNGGYSVISKEAYLKAFKKFDYNPDEIEWTTDDWSSQWGIPNSIESGLINRRGGWNYPTGSEVIPGIIFDWLPDFLRLYFARSIFRANSSFSFWACTLAKGRETPPRIFAPRLDKRVLYASQETYMQETEFDFEEGNHPHWLCITGKDNCDDILFADEPNPKFTKGKKRKKVKGKFKY